MSQFGRDTEAVVGAADRPQFTVGDVARLAGVSVRTLHHYDEIGLLQPSARSEAGYRYYDERDIRRLRRILFYRELEFPLEAIAAMLENGATVDHLRHQHQLLCERRDRVNRLLQAIESELEAQQMGISLTPEEQLEVFGTDQIPAWQQEAHERWGSTDAWRESARRAASYSKDDWTRIKREGDEIEAAFAAALKDGEPPGGERASRLAAAHREHISRWFYACSAEMHRGLAGLYISDLRFAAHYDERAPGLARYVHDAIVTAAAPPPA